MQCEEFDRRLHSLLDRRRSPEYDRPLLAHARSCPPCGELLAAQELLFDTLRQDTASPALGEDFCRRVVEEAIRDPSPRPNHALRQVALAAALLVAALIVLPPLALRDRGAGRWQSMVQRPVGQTATETRSVTVLPPRTMPLLPPERAPLTAAPPKLPAEMGQPAARANDANAGIAERFEDSPLDFALLPPLLAGLQGESFVPVDQLAVGLRPIASSFSVALDALRRSFPIGRDHRDLDRRANITLPGTVQA